VVCHTQTELAAQTSNKLVPAATTQGFQQHASRQPIKSFTQNYTTLRQARHPKASRHCGNPLLKPPARCNAITNLPHTFSPTTTTRPTSPRLTLFFRLIAGDQSLRTQIFQLPRAAPRTAAAHSSTRQPQTCSCSCSCAFTHCAQHTQQRSAGSCGSINNHGCGRSSSAARTRRCSTCCRCCCAGHGARRGHRAGRQAGMLLLLLCRRLLGCGGAAVGGCCDQVPLPCGCDWVPAQLPGRPILGVKLEGQHLHTQ
jgi:hypothetical protein